MFYRLLLVFFVLGKIILGAIVEQCIWYGETENGKNLIDNSAPRRISSNKSVQALLEICPHFKASLNERGILSCCDLDQIKRISQETKRLTAVSSFQPCLKAIKYLICGISCDPRQASYMRVSQSESDGSETFATQVEVLADLSLRDLIENECSTSFVFKFTGVRLISSELFGAPANFNISWVEGHSSYGSGEMRKEWMTATVNEPSKTNSSCNYTYSSNNDKDDLTTVHNVVDDDYDLSNHDKIGNIRIVYLIELILAIVCVLATAALAFHDKIKIDQWRHRSCDQFHIWLESIFRELGKICAVHRFKVIAFSLTICGVLCAGNALFEPTSDPIELWSMKGGRSVREMNYFNNHFGPFYRICQLILTPKNADNKSILNTDYFRELAKIQDEIIELRTTYQNQSINLSSICFKPLIDGPRGCLVLSPIGYLERRRESLLTMNDDDEQLAGHISKCVKSQLDVDCRPLSDGLVQPEVVFGGFSEVNYSSSKSLILTVMIDNQNQNREQAKAWEKTFLDYVEKLDSPNFEFSYIAERSIEDEVSRASKADLSTIIVSYVIMFVYMSIFLGSFKSLRTLFVDTRLILGLCALFMIVVSVLSSFGFYSYLGFETTIIVLEVTPFLLLAVGSGDNFIFVNNYMRKFHGNEAMKIEEKVAANLGEIGPSLLLSSVAQAIAFGIGAVIPVGAIRVFALYSFFGVIVKFVLQVTLFVSIFTLDCKRQHQGRYDLMCCLKTSVKRTSKDYKSISYRLFENYYCPLILNPLAKVGIVVVFVGWFIACLTLIPKVKIGLDQKITFPKGSYVIDYLNAIEQYLSIGTPAYIVFRDDIDYNREDVRRALTGDQKTSFVSMLNELMNMDGGKYLKSNTPFWLSSYHAWVSDSDCCEDFLDSCWTEGEGFSNFVGQYRQHSQTQKCRIEGKAFHKTSIEVANNTMIKATNWQINTAFLSTNDDFVYALRLTRRFSDKISKLLSDQGLVEKRDDVNAVFVYNMLFPFYEQYLSLQKVTLINIGSCVFGVFIVTFLLLGMDFHSSLIVLLTLIMTMVDLFGIMFLSGVDLNAISVVNLVMAVGISVEFYVHIVRDYAVTCVQDTRARTTQVLSNIGSSIFIGVTVPEMMSVAMLSAAESEIFQIYFFRMYLSLILMCTLKALVFLPVLLTYLGPKAMSVKEIHNRQASIRSNSALSIDVEMEPSPSTDLST